jgi:hypothetical protein
VDEKLPQNRNPNGRVEDGGDRSARRQLLYRSRICGPDMHVSVCVHAYSRRVHPGPNTPPARERERERERERGREREEGREGEREDYLKSLRSF